jgi:ADP-heptose:LPS heptosyltransferase
MKPIAGVRKIAVLPPNGIGDLILTFPALEALKSAYRQAELVLLGRPVHAELLSERPGPVDRVFPLAQSCAGWRAAIPTLRRECFDLAVQLHGGGAQSNRFLSSIGAATTIGACDVDAAPLDRTIPYARHQPEILRQLEIVALAGAPPRSLVPRVIVTAKDEAQLDRVLPSPRDGIVVIHPGATDARRRWDAQRYARLAESISALGFQVVLTGDETERPIAHGIGHSARAETIDLTGRLSVGALAALFKRVWLAIGNDTGALHLARAVGARTVTLYWIGNHVNFAPLFRASDCAFVSWTIHCPVCGLEQIDVRCPHDSSFVDSIGLDAVERAAIKILESRPIQQAMELSSVSQSARNR